MAYALITGATKGIGWEIASCLGARHFDLLLIARDPGRLRERAATLSQTYGVQTAVLPLDLALPGAAQVAFDWVVENKWPVKVLVNNAGFGPWGAFEDIPLNTQQTMLRLNTATVLEMSYLFAPVLRAQAPAYILQVGSLGGFQAMPGVAAYAASKAFVKSFSRALHHEWKNQNIHVTLLAPGPVSSPGKWNTASGTRHLMTPAQVAQEAVKGLFRHRIQVIPGRMYRWLALATRLLPPLWVEKMALRLYRRHKE